MQLGIVGLGRMGGGIARRLLGAGHDIVGYDRSEESLAELGRAGGAGAPTYEELAAGLTPPRAVWMMVPSGPVVDAVIEEVLPHLSAGDILIDGGNSNYKDSMRRAAELREHGIEFVDIGTSGGVWGEDAGFCLMVGGSDATVARLSPLFRALAPSGDDGWAHLGPSGAGHFTKMIHNGIEYGLMQAYAEGFALLGAKKEFDVDLEKVAHVWQHGSVVRSWLLELIERALTEHGSDLADIAPYVGDSGMGRWTVQEAVDLDVPAPVLTLALIERISSRDDIAFYHRLLSALRHQFGGHAMEAARSDRAEPPAEVDSAER